MCHRVGPFATSFQPLLLFAIRRSSTVQQPHSFFCFCFLLAHVQPILGRVRINTSRLPLFCKEEYSDSFHQDRGKERSSRVPAQSGPLKLQAHRILFDTKPRLQMENHENQMETQ